MAALLKSLKQKIQVNIPFPKFVL